MSYARVTEQHYLCDDNSCMWLDEFRFARANIESVRGRPLEFVRFGLCLLSRRRDDEIYLVIENWYLQNDVYIVLPGRVILQLCDLRYLQRMLVSVRTHMRDGGWGMMTHFEKTSPKSSVTFDYNQYRNEFSVTVGDNKCTLSFELTGILLDEVVGDDSPFALDY